MVTDESPTVARKGEIADPIRGVERPAHQIPPAGGVSRPRHHERAATHR